MNQMPNDLYTMHDPYVQGAGDPYAQPPAGSMSSGDTMAAPNGMTASAAPPDGAANDMRHGLSEDVIGSPVTVEEAFQGSMRGMLSREIGAYIAATFLMGNGELVRWEGRLYEVGNNYIVIYQQEIGRYVVGDINSLRFVEFSENGSQIALMNRPCTNSPTAW